MFFRLAALGAMGVLGSAGFAFLRKRARRSRKRRSKHAAFADNQGNAEIRDAGPSAMRDQPRRAWTALDEAGDQSFPASDPPGTY